MSEHSSAHFLGEITRDRPKESQEREENSLLLLLCYVPEVSHGCVMGVSFFFFFFFFFKSFY